MQVKNTIRKVGAAAASTLMVGMTLGSAATLADFPGMFIADDGAPTAQIVVGSQGKVSDVVGAVNIAAALGQATVQTSEQTKTKTVSAAGNVGWSATNGQTLDTVNDNLYFGDNIDKVRQTLTADHLDLLSDTELSTEDGSTIAVEHYLNVGHQKVTFGVPSGVDNQDPFLYVDTPYGSNVDASASGGTPSDGNENYLYELQANFEDSLDFYDTSDSSGTAMNENIVGQDVELFGDTFQISKDSFKGDNAGQLVLYGSSQETTLQTGQSQTLTIDGTDYNFNVVAVTDSSTAAFKVNGKLREKTEGSSFSLNGQTIRVDDVIQTSSQNSAGYVTFSLGSQKVVLEDGQPVMTGQDESDVEGTYVNLKGSNLDKDISTSGFSDSNSPKLSSIEIGVGHAEQEDSYVKAGGMFQDPVFEGLSFRFGGLAPNAASGGDSVGQIKFGTSNDETATVSFTPRGGDSSSTVQWFHDNSPGESGTNTDEKLADSDGNEIVVEEGAAVQESEYVATNAGGFSHLWEVTGVDADGGDTSTKTAEGTIELEDVTGDSSVTVDVDETSTEDVFSGTEVIDGQTYNFRVDSSDNVYVTWGAGSSTSSGDTGSQTTVYPALDADSGSAVALTEDVEFATPTATSDSDTSGGHSFTLELPSTESTDAKTLTVETVDVDGDGTTTTNAGDTGRDLKVAGTVVGTEAVGDDTGTLTEEIQVGGVDYVITLDDTVGSGNDYGLSVHVAATQDDDQYDDAQSATAAEEETASFGDAAALAIEPENNAGHEEAYVVSPETDGGNSEVDVGDAGTILYTGNHNGDAGYSATTLESDDSVKVGYDMFGAYTKQVTDNQGSLTLNMPDQQAVAGAAFTGAGGSLSMGGAGQTEVSVTYTGVTNMDMMGQLPDVGMTDQQVTQSTRQNSDLILVGGPAVNTLVSDLASQGETWTTQEWRTQHQGEALIQLVENAFSQGNHALIVAGHSADDTRAAARYISNYGAHQSTLKGKDKYTPSSQEAPR